MSVNVTRRCGGYRDERRALRRIHLCLLIALMAIVPGSEGIDCSGPLYTIQSGDTISALAEECGSDLAAIEAVNPQIAESNLILVGQELCLPSICSGNVPGLSPSEGPAAAPAPSPAGEGCPGLLYSIRSGDTISQLASSCSSTQIELLANNPQILDPSRINIGDKICLPNTCVDLEG